MQSPQHKFTYPQELKRFQGTFLQFVYIKVFGKICPRIVECAVLSVFGMLLLPNFVSGDIKRCP